MKYLFTKKYNFIDLAGFATIMLHLGGGGNPWGMAWVIPLIIISVVGQHYFDK